MTPNLLLINPWIYDFAAFDLWSKPLGLLLMAADLRNMGYRVRLLDCMDVHHPQLKTGGAAIAPKRGVYGTGKFPRQAIEKPVPLKDIPRTYARYGIPPSLFKTELRNAPLPDAVLVTSHMTYWYPGVRDAVRWVRAIHPRVPVLLGGIYAKLCTDHAKRHVNAHRILPVDDATRVAKALQELGVPLPDAPARLAPPYAAYDLLHGLDAVCIATSVGCPYRCAYCAGPFLQPKLRRRDPGDVLAEIQYWHRERGVRDIAFYDDALLISPREHAVPLFEGICELRLPLRFHTPNALHVKEITPRIAELMKAAGFRTIRLGLETTAVNSARRYDAKVGPGDFRRAIACLRQAGFPAPEIGVYLLAGLPEQTAASVLAAIEAVADAGAVPYLAEYSPIPHSPMWPKAVRTSPHDLEGEPLFHNNTLYSCWEKVEKGHIPTLKRRVSEIRTQYREIGFRGDGFRQTPKA